MQILELPTGFRVRPEPIREAHDLKRTRAVVGDDSEALRVPGLLAVESVIVGGERLPEKMVFDVPLDGTERPEMRRLAEAGYRLERAVDGCPVLERNYRSDFGRWPKGVSILVTGEWDEAVSPPPESLPPEPARPSPVILATGAPARGEAAPVRGAGGRFGRS